MKQTLPKKTVLSLAAVFTLALTHAGPVTVLNQDFNLQPQASGATTVLTPAGPTDWNGFNAGSGGNWDIGLTGAHGSDFTDPLTAPASPVDNYLWINRFNGNGTQVAGIYQDIGGLLANTAYTLTIAIGHRADTGPGPGGSWSPGIISLLNGTDNTGTVLASTSGLPSTADTWQDFSINYTTGASVSGDLSIMLSVLDASSIQADFSNVRLDATAVPEPGTCVLVGGGLMLFAIALRRQKVAVN